MVKERGSTPPIRYNEDERVYICPLQLDFIERCVRLWSNRGETVLSPFAGIGSEGVISLRHHRRFVGCELKASYYKTALENLDAELTRREMPGLFELGEVAP